MVDESGEFDIDTYDNTYAVMCMMVNRVKYLFDIRMSIYEVCSPLRGRVKECGWIELIRSEKSRPLVILCSH
jgi:hypothetical protein